MFPILVSLLIVIALIIIIVPLWRVEEFEEISREDQNIAIAKSKLAELKQQLEDSEINDSQFTIAKNDLENALALDLENQKVSDLHQGGRWLIILLAIALPAASAGMYWKLGTPDLLDPQAKLAEMQHAKKDVSQMSMTEVLDMIKKRISDNPEDGEGWYILGRTFMNIQKYPEAVTAYQRAYKFVGDEPNIMLALADALAMTNEGLMIGEPEKLVEKAIAIDPNNEIGLWLGGLAAEQRNDFPKAYLLWSRLLPLMKEDPNSYKEIESMLAQLKESFPELGNNTTAQVNAPIDKKVDTGIKVNLSISINSSISQQLTGNEQVFVYAKAVTGPPMPLAAKKLKVSDLPLTVTLSDADAMMPQLKLSSVDAFTVGARVSMTGNPIPQNGDFFVEVSPLDKSSVNQVISLDIINLVSR